jgi:hypothetical protein
MRNGGPDTWESTKLVYFLLDNYSIICPLSATLDFACLTSSRGLVERVIADAQLAGSASVRQLS